MRVLLSNNGNESWWEIPMNCSEITFEQFIDFTYYEQRYFKASTKTKVEDEIAENNYDDLDKSIEHLYKAVGFVVKGELDDLIFQKGESVSNLIDAKWTLTLESLGEELTLLKLYAHIINLLSSYKAVLNPPDFELEWSGNKYVINKEEAVRSLLNVPLTAGEMITTLELQKKTLKMVEKKGDPEGNLAFNLGLQEFAVLMRRPKERLPSNRRKRITFIDRRVKIFRKLPMDVVLNVRFFLVRSMVDYMKTQLTSSSSTLQKSLERPPQNVRPLPTLRKNLV